MDDVYENYTLVPNTSSISDEYINEFGLSINELEPKRDSLYIVIPITIIYGIIFFTGLIGNMSTCIVIARNKSMHTATNYYLFSLAISDLLLLVSGLPQEMYSIWSRYPYVFGEAFCVIRGLAAETSANATVLTITCFTVERYVAICHPFLSHTMSKLSRAVKLILAVWVIALCFAIPQALQFGVVYEPSVLCMVKRTLIEHSFELSTFLFFVAPMTLITVLYALIGLQLRSSNMMNRDRSKNCKNQSNCVSADEQKRSCRHHQGRSTKRLINMLVAVVAAFFICWAPFHAQRLVAIYGIGSITETQHPLMFNVYVIITYISGVLYYVSTTINPLLYHIMSNKFRDAFKETFWRCCGRTRRSVERRSYSVLSRNGAAAVGPGSGGGTDHRSVPETHSHSAAHDSTDSGMSMTQRHSSDCLCCVQSQTGPRSQLRRDTPDTTMTEYSTGINAFQHSLMNKVELQPETESLGETNRNKRLKHKRLQTKTNRFLRVFHCLAKKTLDEGIQSRYSTPTKESRALQSSVQESYCMVPCNVSNSSLKDVEQGALEDELTAYMKEIQNRELAMR